MLSPRIESVRLPAGVQPAMSKDSMRVLGVGLLTLMLEMPSPGLIVTSSRRTLERSKPPDDATTRLGELPAVTGGGAMLIDGGPCETPIGVTLLTAACLTEPIMRSPGCGKPVI